MTEGNIPKLVIDAMRRSTTRQGRLVFKGVYNGKQIYVFRPNISMKVGLPLAFSYDGKSAEEIDSCSVMAILRSFLKDT